MEKQPTRQSALQAKAIAAAKLVLQDLDPAAKKRRQLFSSGRPQGILAIHFKTLRNFSKTFFFTSTFAGCSEIRLFLKISIQNSVKCSKVLTVRKDAANQQKSKLVLGKQNKLWPRKATPTSSDMRQRGSSVMNHRESLATGHAEITLDELKTFSLELSNKQDDADNKIILEIMEADCAKTRSALNIGCASLHLFDLIKEMYGTKSTPLMIKDKRIADLDYEYVFRYGAFGYGYSHELQQSEISISQIMNESMFFRLTPPADRMDDDGLLAPTQVPPPNSIKRERKEEDEEATMRNKAVLSSIDMFKSVDTSNVDNLLEHRHRLQRLKSEYLALKTRSDRNKYLENLLSKTGQATGESQNDGTAGNAEESRLGGTATDNQRQADVKNVIENLSPLLLMAPGLQSRVGGETRPSLRPRDSARPSDSDGIDPMEKLRKLYEDNMGSSSSEADRPSSSEKQSRPTTPQSSEKRGFMGILKKKVLAPMRFNKLMTGVAEAHKQTQELSNAEEGRSSRPGTPDNELDNRNAPRITDVMARLTSESASRDSDRPRRSFMAAWTRRTAPSPTTVDKESENTLSSTTRQNMDDVE
ncbi:uncharacterized protein LOC120326319 [Styela clava]